jgi:DNA ligase (NAD+)
LIQTARNVKKSVPAWQLLASMGINGAGKTAGRALMTHFASQGNIFTAIASADISELEKVEDFGPKTAQAVYDWFQKYGKKAQNLLKYVEPELPKQGKFTGQKFVFTGGFPGGKRKWEQAVEDEGGKCGNSVSKDTNFVVVGTDAGSKEAAADKLGIKKISVEELEKML